MGRVVSIGECMIEMSGGDDQVYKQGFAGDTLNTAWYMRSALGADWQVDYFTAVGDDLYSDRMLAFLGDNQIGTEKIRRIDGKRPGLYMIHQADGDRHFTYWRENAAARQLADDANALNKALDGASLIYFSGITLAILEPKARAAFLVALAAARAAGAETAFDPNIRPILWRSEDELKDAVTAAAAVSTFVLPTHSDEAPFFGDASPQATADRYLKGGAREVIVKDGAEDALIVRDGETVSVPAQKGANVVDATGAGDSFNGAYLAARLAGASLSEAGAAAHQTAAKVIGHRGALMPRDILEK